MNKNQIDAWIPKAYKMLNTIEVTKNNVSVPLIDNGAIPKVFRSYISSFGAAVVMGSLKSAIAFYSQQSSAMCEREALMKIIYAIISDEDDVNAVEATALFQFVNAPDCDLIKAKEDIYNAAIAIKLALNMFVLTQTR